MRVSPERPSRDSEARAKVWRLRPKGEFEQVRQNGRSWSHPLLVIIARVRTATSIARPRVATTAGKRLGSAVVRNRLRRKMREAVRQVYAYLPAQIDLIVMARAPMIDADVSSIAAALSEILHRAHLWQASSPADLDKP